MPFDLAFGASDVRIQDYNVFFICKWNGSADIFLLQRLKRA